MLRSTRYLPIAVLFSLMAGAADASVTISSDAGFDTEIWGLDATTNGGLPYLLNNLPAE